MKVIYGLGKRPWPIKKVVATIGVFDGVHRGHQRIIQKTILEAHKERAKSLVVTFWPHPIKVLEEKKHSLMLTSLKHRLNLINKLNPNFCLVIKFSRHFSSLSPEEFIHTIIKNIDIKKIVVGHDFIFGKNAKGNIGHLEKFGKKFNFSVIIIPEYSIGVQPIRSSLIRGLIKKGKLLKAMQCLNRPVSAYGKVIKGNERGRILGYPTANIKTEQEILPPDGVYLIQAILGNKVFFGICNIGKRPTFDNLDTAILEVHIFNFKEDIYGKEIEVVFLKKIRSEKKFSSKDALIKQIQKDEYTVKNLLKAPPRVL